MIVFLTENYPLTKYNLNHLKRIDSKSKNPKRIFVCPLFEDENSVISDSHDGEASSQISVENLNDSKLSQFLTENQITFLLLTDIPASIPITRRQNIFALKLWPVNFHENKQ